MSYAVRQPSMLRQQKQSSYKQREGFHRRTQMGEDVLKPTYTNGSRSDGSNLECILDYTTPSVQCRYPAKSAIAESICERWGFQSESMPYFSLGDLWRSYDEWSAYGAGVPLRLPSGETIVQYYVPYLSALQIYLHPGSSFFFSSKRRPGDESDWSDASDMRDVNSDVGSDNENEKLSRLQIKADNWESSSSHSSASSEQGDRQGELVFEYFERCSPYGRAPFAGKISELATRFSPLLSLTSDELSPSSWLSVAWYPIYRIPMGPTMNDLSTCFLTFHSLWTPPSLQDAHLECKTTPYHCMAEACLEHGSGYSRISSLLPEDCSCRLEQAQWLRDHSAWRIDAGVLKLRAFGLASYKLQGPFWASAAPADKRRASSLASSAEAWLKLLRVQHPDFEFFSSREGLRFDR